MSAPTLDRRADNKRLAKFLRKVRVRLNQCCTYDSEPLIGQLDREADKLDDPMKDFLAGIRGAGHDCGGGWER